EQEAIRLRLREIQHELAGLDTVDAEAPSLDDPLLAQTGQGAEGPRARGVEPSEPLVAVEILREIMDPHEVETVDAEAFQAVLDRSQSAVLRVVVNDAVGPAGLEDAALFTEVAGLGLDLVQNQSTDLGTEDVVVTPVSGECLAQAHLGKAGAVE